MFIRLIITQLLTLSILFSNIAWAMDECSWFTNVSGQEMSQTATPPSDNGSVTGSCNSYCIGWIHLLYINYQASSINTITHHFDGMPKFSFYHSLQRKPLTEPPQA